MSKTAPPQHLRTTHSGVVWIVNLTLKDGSQECQDGLFNFDEAVEEAQHLLTDDDVEKAALVQVILDPGSLGSIVPEVLAMVDTLKQKGDAMEVKVYNEMLEDVKSHLESLAPQNINHLRDQDDVTEGDDTL